MLTVVLALSVALTVAVVLVGVLTVLLVRDRKLVAPSAREPRVGSPQSALDEVGAQPQPGAQQSEPEAQRASPSWCGAFTPFSVGDPGRAAMAVRPQPDPRSWDRRETVLDGVSFRDGTKTVCELRAASVRGLSHANYGTVRQDEYAYRRSADGRYLVVAVADGVSSGRYSEQAAIVVTRRGCDLIVAHLAEHGLGDLPWAGLTRAVASLVEDRGRQLLHRSGGDGGVLSTRDIAGELAATALFAVVDLRVGPDGFPVHLLALGDTSAWVLRSGQWEAQQAVKNAGEVIASSSTAAIPLVPEQVGPPVHTTVRPGEALVLMSDGIGDPLGDGRGEVGAFLAEFWSSPPRTALEFAAHVGFARKSFDDDRTAVALWPMAGP